jgi:hypothetical protein
MMTPHQRYAYEHPVVPEAKRLPPRAQRELIPGVRLMLAISRCNVAFDGDTIWVAAISVYHAGVVRQALEWKPDLVQRHLKKLVAALRGVGDESRERCFRGAVTLHLHRALTAEEYAGLPEAWRALVPIGVAESPVEIIYTKGLRESLAAEPCRELLQRPLEPVQVRQHAPPLWIPKECAQCDTCKAREELRRKAAERAYAAAAQQAESGGGAE